MLVKIIKNPVTRFKIGAGIGETITVPDRLAKEMISEGYAESADPKPKAKRTRKKKTDESKG